VHLERKGVGFKGVTIVLQEGDCTLQWQRQDYFLVHTTVTFAAIGEAADEILIKQQLLHFIIYSNVFQITSRGSSEIINGSRAVKAEVEGNKFDGLAIKVSDDHSIYKRLFYVIFALHIGIEVCDYLRQLIRLDAILNEKPSLLGVVSTDTIDDYFKKQANRVVAPSYQIVDVEAE
jgi:hypothetical protein